MKKFFSYIAIVAMVFTVYCGLNLTSVSAAEKDYVENVILEDSSNNDLTDLSNDADLETDGTKDDTLENDKHFEGKDEGITPPTPEIPVVPEEPTVPELPEKPERPVKPEEPTEPEKPVVPELPEKPDEVEPGNPEIPMIPLEPAIPVVPEEPVVPEVPEIPVIPEEPVVPEVPEIPEIPETPVVPVVPEEPVIPETPIVNETPQQEIFLSARRGPQTGDTTDTFMYVSLMGLSVIILLVLKKKKSDANKDNDLCTETSASNESLTEKSPFTINKIEMANTIEYEKVVSFVKTTAKERIIALKRKFYRKR